LGVQLEKRRRGKEFVGFVGFVEFIKILVIICFFNLPAQVHNDKAIFTKVRLTHFGGIHADTHVGARTVW
jgi:hypothetical protein